MDFIIEFVGEVLLEIGFSVAKDKKVSKFIRYPMILLISLFILFILFVIGYFGISAIMNPEGELNILFGLLLLAFDIILIVFGIIRIKEVIKKEKDNKYRTKSTFFIWYY